MARRRNLIRRMLLQNREYGTGGDEMDAIFWRYRGKKLPGKDVKSLNRAGRRYLRQGQALYTEQEDMN